MMNSIDTPPPLQPPPRVKPLQVLLHVGIVFGFLSLGGFVVGLVSALADLPQSSIVIASIVFVTGSAGFAVAGCRAIGHRWAHLSFVAVGTWIASLVNLLAELSFLQWCFSIIGILVMMGVGGGISSLLKSNNG